MLLFVLDQETILIHRCEKGWVGAVKQVKVSSVFFSRKFQGGVSFVDPFSDLCFKTNLYVHHMLGKGCPLGAFLSDVSL